MTITNSRGTVVYTETTEVVNGFIRPVNFTGMEGGSTPLKLRIFRQTNQKIAHNNEALYAVYKFSKNKEGANILLAVANDGAEQINGHLQWQP